MNTKLLMTVSALTMGIMGIALSFLPQEILAYLDLESTSFLHKLILQVLGALYFGFAMINWTAKSNLIGGIYGRPIAIGNLTHFVIGALALGKGYFAWRESVVLILFLFYLVFAVLFTIVFYSHPLKKDA